MSDTADKLFANLKAMQQGLLSAGTQGLQEVGAEVRRLGTQGSMEFASALFNGHAFVPYGPGQYTPSPSQAQSPEHTIESQPEIAHDLSRGR
jgi:hypothetical protein